MKRFLFVFIILLIPLVVIAQDLPYLAKLYYLDSGNPWTTIYDSSISREEIISSIHSKTIVINRPKSLKAFYLDSVQLQESKVIASVHDPRFVLVLEYQNRSDTLSLPMARSLVSMFNQTYFVNEDFYDQAINAIIREDRLLKKKYRISLRFLRRNL